MFPTSISSLEEALTLFDDSLQKDATSYGKIILVEDTYVGDIWCFGIDEEDKKMAMLSIVIFDKSKLGQGIAATAIPQFLDEVFIGIRSIQLAPSHTYPISVL